MQIEMTLRCSMLEIYKEALRDLLCEEKVGTWNKRSSIRGIFVDAFNEECVTCYDEISSYWNKEITIV